MSARSRRTGRPRLHEMLRVYFWVNGHKEIARNGTYSELRDAIIGDGPDIANRFLREAVHQSLQKSHSYPSDQESYFAHVKRMIEQYVLPKKVVALPFARKSFYDTDEWRALRYQALKIHGAACQCCGNRASPGKPLHVDHIKPRSKYPELELELSNLQILCVDCNLGKSNKDETDWREAAE